MNCLFNNPFSLSAEQSLPLSQPSPQVAQLAANSGGDTAAAPTAPTGLHTMKDPLVDISLKMLQSLEPRLQHDPQVTGFGNYMESVLEDLPRDLRSSCIEDMTKTLWG